MASTQIADLISAKFDEKVKKRVIFRKDVANLLKVSMKLTCDECQRDRLRCALEPMCKDRIYLSFLIEAGVDKKELPQLCYRFRLDEVNKFYNKKPIPVSLDDAKVYLSDFLQIFKIRPNTGIKKALETISQKIKDKWKDVYYEKISKNLWVLILDKGDVITLIDGLRRIVNINVREDYGSIENAFKILEAVGKLNELEISYIRPHKSVVYVKIAGNKERFNLASNSSKDGFISYNCSDSKCSAVFPVIAGHGFNLRELIDKILNASKG